MNQPIMFLDQDSKTKLATASSERNIIFDITLAKKVVEKSNQKNFKAIKNALPNKSGNSESLNEKS